jgi:signal transduction histidine kinase
MVQMRKNFSTDLGELKYMVYAHDKVLVFSIPILEDLILVFSTEKDVNVNGIVTTIIDYIRSVESELKLEKPRKMVDEEKKRMVRNLHDSGITEDLIAEQMDLDINTVKILIQEPIV